MTLNEYNKIRYNVESLYGQINSDKKFFSSLINYIYNLKEMIEQNSFKLDDAEYLIKKIDNFYEEYRAIKDSDVLYFEPAIISNSNSIVLDIIESINILKKMTPEEIFILIHGNQKTEQKKEIFLEIYDQKLIKVCKPAYDTQDWWDLVLKATRHLEVRIREKANLSAEYIGTDLINKAFNPNTGKLKIPSCAVIAEEEGFSLILRGIAMFHRNVKGHREGEIDKKRAIQIVNYIDYLLDMVDSSVLR